MIEFNSLINSIQNNIHGIPFFNGILSNIVYVSITLSILLIIMILFIYPCKETTPAWVLAKLFVYLSITNLIIFSMHNSIMKNKYSEKFSSETSEKFINNINSRGGSASIYNSENIKVVPTFKEIDSDEIDGTNETSNEINKGLTVSDILDDVERQQMSNC